MSRSIPRREFLQRSLAAGVLSYTAPLGRLGRELEFAGPTGAPRRVIIVGAGLAGLVAGYELRRAGHDVVILEGQRRAGGRVRTLRDGFSDGLYAEVGASRIPRSHELTIKYAQQFGLELVPFRPERNSDVVLLGDRRYPMPQGTPVDLRILPLQLTPEERALGMDGIGKKYLGPLLGRLGDPVSAGWPPASLRRYDEMDLVEYLRSQGASPDAVRALVLGLGDPDRPGWPSALWVAREFALGWATGGMQTIRGGMDRLPRAFAERLAPVIQYDAKVVRIQQDRSGAAVTVLQAGRTAQVRGDAVICTVPFSVLREIDVAPAFSASKRRAVMDLNYWPITRVYLQMRRRFWLERGCNGFALTDQGEEIWDATWNQTGKRGILVCYAKGERAEALSRLGQDERVELVLEHVERIHPGAREHFEAGYSHCWHLDPWARGGVAAMLPGQLTSFGSDIGTAEGRIHFAGEHASPWQGWMQGALWSGLRAARAITDPSSIRSAVY